ncbi:hypothetical protein D4764_01G0015510 [Takifugu flavidus]|uniref:Uncharacterized protein n=1 Tax=Takifugu flavidus TaxID=433684 RepID=A0A5C6PS30_9TELE|nr:hypothetical protein D4764_01G0015510 [Takifugu flavidus]
MLSGSAKKVFLPPSFHPERFAVRAVCTGQLAAGWCQWVALPQREPLTECLGGLPLPSVSRGTFLLRRTPESSPVQEDCSVLRTHRCSEFLAVQGDCVWFGDSPTWDGRTLPPDPHAVQEDCFC